MAIFDHLINRFKGAAVLRDVRRHLRDQHREPAHRPVNHHAERTAHAHHGRYRKLERKPLFLIIEDNPKDVRQCRRPALAKVAKSAHITVTAKEPS
jgi:hypothetical protein